MKPEPKFEYQVTLEWTRKERIVVFSTTRVESAEHLRRRLEAKSPRDYVVEISTVSVQKSYVDSGHDSHDDTLEICTKGCVP